MKLVTRGARRPDCERFPEGSTSTLEKQDIKDAFTARLMSKSLTFSPVSNVYENNQKRADDFCRKSSFDNIAVSHERTM